MQAIVREPALSARLLRIRVRLRVGRGPRDLPLYEECVNVGRKPRCVLGLADDIAAKGIAERPEERFGCIGVEFQVGGSWMRIGPSLSPNPVISPRNRCKGSATLRSRPSCVIVFGIFTANRKGSGTSSAQRW